LIRDGTIQFKHRSPKGSYKLADGTIVEYKRTLIPSLTVGGNRVSNVAASIVPDDQPLLLGKSFLDKFKSWKIDNSKGVLIIQID
jgi:predicted aspartyl protease